MSDEHMIQELSLSVNSTLEKRPGGRRQVTEYTGRVNGVTLARYIDLAGEICAGLRDLREKVERGEVDRSVLDHLEIWMEKRDRPALTMADEVAREMAMLVEEFWPKDICSRPG